MLKTRPCGNAIAWAVGHGCKSDLVQLTKDSFDKLLDDDLFSSPPLVDGFGDGHGEPYRPYRQAYGELKDGRFVYCETHSSRQEPPDA